MGGSDLVGHNEDGPGFFPILREVDSKKEVILQKWELKACLGTNKGADLEIWELVGWLLAARSGVSPSPLLFRAYTSLWRHYGDLSSGWRLQR